MTLSDASLGNLPGFLTVLKSRLTMLRMGVDLPLALFPPNLASEIRCSIRVKDMLVLSDLTLSS